jgi:hypothetical protein
MNGMNEPSTRLDIRVKRGAQGDVTPDTSSIEIDIAIDITGSDTPALPIRHEGPPPVPFPLPGAEYVDEAPTEVFRPGKHPAPPPPTSQRRPPSTRPPGRPNRVPVDPWEAKTVVRREDGAPPPSRRREPAPRADHTVRMDPRKIEVIERAPESIEIDFSDETKMLPPRRPSR